MRNVFLLLILVVSCSSPSPRQVQDFNFDWEFKLDKDSVWRSLHLPHDWSVEGEFSANNPSKPSGGALPGGIGTYRKHFQISKDSLRKYFVEFDGVFMDSRVYVNGEQAGYRPYGYSSFSYDITDKLVDGENEIAVICDNSDQPNSRWYAGCGIYRDVRLVITSRCHVDYSGVYVTTEGEKVRAVARICGAANKVSFAIVSPDNRTVVQVPASESNDGLWSAELNVASPALWDIETPSLYKLIVNVFDTDNNISDTYSQTFGFRTTSWDNEKGFFLNGRHVKLQGVCLHHDLGCIGSAFHPVAMEKRLNKLKEMGCNAIRTSHNPPAPAFLDMCDRMGFLVICEALDMWRIPKTEFDYARFFDEWHEKDICDMVLLDRNHPCIILWSAGNEIPEQYRLKDSTSVYELCRHLVSLFKTLDPSRKVTVGLDGINTSNLLIKSGAFDVLGINYHTQLYDDLPDMYPGMPLYGSETASALCSRGWYPQPSNVYRQLNGVDDEFHQCPSYDVTSAPWSQTHSYSLSEMMKRENIAGGFVWTGYDYLGEPTPYSWPSRSSYFGIIDLAGFPKDAFYLYQSQWTDKDVLHLFPHWNWSEGDSVDLWCYYNHADSVELRVNGKSLGFSSSEPDRYQAQWLKVPFEPGEIRAIAYRGGEVACESVRHTSGEPVSLCLCADKNLLHADGYDLSYVTVTALDADGREVPTASDMLTFSVSGPGELFGVDNGNAADTLSLKGSEKSLFAGKAIAVIRSIKDEKGTISLSVSSDYNTQIIEIKSK